MLVRRKLRKLINYDKDSGLVLTRCSLSLQSAGYVRIEIDGVSHRLVDVLYILANGELPRHTQVIQKNKSKLDFRLSNLEVDFTKVNKMKEEDEAQKRRELRELKKIAKEKHKLEVQKRRELRELKEKELQDHKAFMAKRHYDFTKDL